jgi:anti-anti-sigma factor
MRPPLDAEFTATVERIGPAAVLRLTGELDLATAPQVTDAIHAFEQPCNCIVLDLSELAFIDSTGLHLAVDEYKRAAADGFEFVVTGAHGPVLRAFELAGLSDALPMAPGVDSVITTAHADAA